MANKNKILSAAQKHIQKGNYERAIRELRKLTEEDPKDVRTLLKIGDLYTKKGAMDEAIQVYQQVAEFYSEQGFFLKAVAVYKTVMKHVPTHLDVANKLAELYEHLGLVQEAMGQFQSIALLYEQNGSPKLALDALTRMVDLDPGNIASRVRLAEAYSKQEMLQEAANEFSEAAEALRDQDRIADYIKVAERLVYHAPNRTDVIKDLARIYLQHNDTKRALAKLQLAFQVTPDDVETLTMLASAFQDEGETAKTLFVYRELVKVYNSKNKTNDAMVIYQRIIELDPEDLEAKNALGLVPKPPSIAPAKSGRPRSTLNAAKAKSEPTGEPKNSSDEVEKLLTETEVYVKYGLHKKAIEHLRNILKIDADNVEVHERLAGLYEKTKETEFELETWVKLIRIHSSRQDETAAGKAREKLKALRPEHPATKPDYNFDDPFEEEFDVDMSTGAFDATALQEELASQSSEGIEIDFDGARSNEENPFSEVSSFDVDFDIDSGTGDISFDSETPATKESPSAADALGAAAGAVDPADFGKNAVIGFTMETPINELPSADKEKVDAYEEDLDAAELFIDQEMYEDARSMLEHVLEKAPAYQRAIELKTKLDLLAADTPSTANMDDAIRDAMESASTGELNLPSSIDKGLPISENDSFMERSEPIDESDESELESRFDLALAYREMGMLEEAIVEFQIASQAASKTLDSYIEIGRCFIEQGDSISAVGYFFNAIDSGASDEMVTELHYEIGCAYESANDYDLALHWFETAHEVNPEFKDLAARIKTVNDILSQATAATS